MFPCLQERNLFLVSGFITQNIQQIVLWASTKHLLWKKASHRYRELITRKHFHQLQRWNLFNLCLTLLPLNARKLIKWMWRVHFIMGILKLIFTWNNHRGSPRTNHWSAYYEKLCMVSNKPHVPCMPIWMICYCLMDFHYHSDPNVLWKDDALLFLVIYVDDLLIIWSSLSFIATLKYALHDRFCMRDLGLCWCEK